jgi:hypothetical protein
MSNASSFFEAKSDAKTDFFSSPPYIDPLNVLGSSASFGSNNLARNDFGFGCSDSIVGCTTRGGSYLERVS